MNGRDGLHRYRAVTPNNRTPESILRGTEKRTQIACDLSSEGHLSSSGSDPASYGYGAPAGSRLPHWSVSPRPLCEDLLYQFKGGGYAAAGDARAATPAG